MTDGAIGRSEEFFLRLAESPHPLLHETTATIRIDADGDPPWYLTIDRGRIKVTRADAPADAVMRTDRAFLERMVTGEANPFTAALRGRMKLEGDLRLLVVFKTVLPGPPRHRTEVPEPVSTTPDGSGGTEGRR